jgi:hypothetical protein
MSERNPFAGLGLGVAAAALLGMHGDYTPPETYARHFRKADVRKAQGVPTKKRAKVKAARKAAKRNRK